MENTNVVKKTNKFGFKSMPANSSWWKFFVNAFFTRNYFNYKGRASRKEYWTMAIVNWLLTAILNAIAMICVMNGEISFLYLTNIATIYVQIPALTLCIRRFHDINMSAWWGVLIIPWLFLPFFKGDKKDNKYGENIYPTTEA